MKPDAVPAMAAGFKPSSLELRPEPTKPPFNTTNRGAIKGSGRKVPQPLGGNRIVRDGILS